MLDVIDRSESVVLLSSFWRVRQQAEAVNCPCGSVVEHSLGKGEVAGPIPAMGTKFLVFRQFCKAELKKWQKANSNVPSPT